MALTLYRSHRIEDLVDGLTARLAHALPSDPFQRVPLCVGSRGMARWLEHELATRLGVAAGLDFPFPRAALGGAARWVLEARDEPGVPFWDAAFWEARGGDARAPGAAPDRADEAWEPDALAFRVLGLLRRHAGPGALPGASSPDWFEAPRRYLALGAVDAAGEGGVSRRELHFARATAAVLDGLVHELPHLALRWARAPDDARSPGLHAGSQEHRWLAALAADLGVHEDPSSPALRLEALSQREPASSPPGGRPWLGVFGLSTLGPGDRALLEILGRHLDVDLFLLAPSPYYWADMVQRVRATDPDAADRALHDNPILASLGRASAEIVRWVAERDLPEEQLDQAGWVGGVAYRDASTPPPPQAGDGVPGSLLHVVQRWVYGADGVVDPSVRLGEPYVPPESLAGVRDRAEALVGDGSLRFHATYGPLRQCEVLRDELLRRFAEDPSLDPREVLVMTPQVDVFAPLLVAVFARQGLAVRAADPAAPTDPAEPTDSTGSNGGAEPAGAQPADAETTPLPRLEAAISDLGLRQTNPVAEVLLAALELAGERITAPRVAALLGLDPVRRRLGLDEDDVAAVVDALVASQVRWGLDAADRARQGQPARDANTLRFGAERVALGALMPVPDGLAVLRPAPPEGADAPSPNPPPGSRTGGQEARRHTTLGGQGDQPLGAPLDAAQVADPEPSPGVGGGFGPWALSPGAVPLAVAGAEGREGERRAGALALVTRRLAWVRGLLAGPHTVAAWVERLGAVMEGLAETTEAAGWLKLQVTDELESLKAAAAGAGDLTLSREAMAAWLEGRFDNPVSGLARPVTGAISVSGLEPMRAVPFRVVALLGMDDGVFPRDPVRPAWDPLQGVAGGPLARRDVDRHLLLEALLSAREALWVLWTGRDARRNDERPAAVPIEELLETLGRITGLPREALVTEHPLQPWSPRAYGAATDGAAWGGGAPAASLEVGWARAAEHLWAAARDRAVPAPRGLLGAGVGPAGPVPLAPERTPPAEVNLHALAAGLYRGGRTFLQRRLQLPRDAERSWPTPYDPVTFPEEGEGDGDWVEAALREMMAEPSLLEAAVDAAARVAAWQLAQEAEEGPDDGFDEEPGEEPGEESGEDPGEEPGGPSPPPEIVEAQAVWDRWVRRYSQQLYRRLEAEGRTPPRSLGLSAVHSITTRAAVLAARTFETVRAWGSLEPTSVSISALVDDEAWGGPQEGPQGGPTRVTGEWVHVLRVPPPAAPLGREAEVGAGAEAALEARVDRGAEATAEASAGGGAVAGLGLVPGRWLLSPMTHSISVNDWSLLGAWLGVLGAAASGEEDVRGAVLVAPDGLEVVRAPAPAAARRLLTDLVAAWRRGRRQPLPLFKKTSPALAASVLTQVEVRPDGQVEALSRAQRRKLAEAVRESWLGGWNAPGDIDEPEVALLFAGYDPLEEIQARGLDACVVRWALRVWGPLQAAVEELDPDVVAAVCGVAGRPEGGGAEAPRGDGVDGVDAGRSA